MKLQDLDQLQKRLANVYAPDTAQGGIVGPTPSAGHCAAVAIIVRDIFGGTFVSAIVNGQSHWFNRIDAIDVDLTCDQFGMDVPVVGKRGKLHPGSRVRLSSEVNEDTERRASILRSRLDALGQK